MSNSPDRTSDRPKGERLQRVLADAGVAARRACEQLIVEGRVTVNGRRVRELPAFVTRRDTIAVDGVAIPPRAEPTYVILNKPPKTLAAARDEPGKGRRTASELVSHPLGTRLFPVGRLPFNATGLMLFTNDGELANRLSHPRYGVPRTYLAQVKTPVMPADLVRIEHEVERAEKAAARREGRPRPARVQIQIANVRGEADRTVLAITLVEGRGREVGKVLKLLGMPVRKLEQVSIGPLELGDLPRGRWRELGRREVLALRTAIADATGGPRPRGVRPKPGRRRARAERPAGRRGRDEGGHG